MSSYFKDRRDCGECGVAFWGTAGANYCSSPCRGRAWRAKRKIRSLAEVHDVCREMLRRAEAENAESGGKLLRRMFRTVAAELRKRGVEPLELLVGLPDEPVAPEDAAQPGVAGITRTRRSPWSHEAEIDKLEREIAKRMEAGRPFAWHFHRRQQLLALRAGRASPHTEGGHKEGSVERG